MTKHHDQKKRGKGRVCFTLPLKSPSLKKHWSRETIEECCLLTSLLPRSSIIPRELGPPIVLIKKMPHWLAHRPSHWGHFFFTWGSVFSNDPCVELAKTLASIANLRFVFSLILVVLLWLLNYFKIYPEITELVSAALPQNSLQIKPVGSDVEVLPSPVLRALFTWERATVTSFLPFSNLVRSHGL